MKFNDKIKISDRVIAPHEPVFIIAEAGVNHNGDMDKARALIDLAVEAGADAVKFQTFKAEHLILKNVQKAPYQTKTTDVRESQFDMLRRLEVSKEQNQMLSAYCRKKGIIFLTTPFDEVSLDELDSLNLPAYKIASTDTTNVLFLKKVALKNKPIILSTGMSDLSDVETALKVIYPLNKDVVLLQCTANYPIEDAEANLAVIRTFQDRFDLLVGYSDHTVGVGASPYAVALGSRVIEKHFTLDKNLEGPDHKASLDPTELKLFVSEIRRVERYLGGAEKVLTGSEQQTRKSLQKALVASRPIKKGDAFSEENLVAKRTGGNGISAIRAFELIGTISQRDFRKDEIITLDA